jgi:hypothetical protein
MQPQDYFIILWGTGARRKEDDVMARPKKERELSNTHIISIRLADIDIELLEAVRKKTNYSRSEYIRELIRGHTVKQEIHIQATDDVLSTFARSLQDICLRLNRIEKYFDTGGLRSLAMEDAIHQCIDDLMKLRKEFLGYAYDMKK